MRAVNFELDSTSDDPVDFTIQTEVLRGETWTVVTSEGVTSGTPPATRKIILEDNERIVISARGEAIDMVFDKEQNAAMPRHAFESQPTLAERQAKEDERQAELRAGKRLGEKTAVLAERSANQARDEVIAEQQEKARLAAEQKTKEEADRLSKSQADQATTQSNVKPETSVPPKPVVGSGSGGMTAPGPSTGGQSSKDVKK